MSFIIHSRTRTGCESRPGLEIQLSLNLGLEDSNLQEMPEQMPCKRCPHSGPGAQLTPAVLVWCDN